MIDSKVMNLMLSELDSNDEKFKVTLDKFIKIGLKVAQGSEDFQEELKQYGDILFHIYVNNIDFNIWIKKIQENLTYNNSFYEKSSKGMKTIHFILTKETMRKIFKAKLEAMEAWFKGLIRIEGDLSDAIIAKNLIKTFLLVLNHYMKNSN